MYKETCSDRWSQLQEGILCSIVQHLPLEDHLRCAEVCTSWRAALARSKARPVDKFPQVLYTASRTCENDHLFLISLAEGNCSTIDPRHTRGGKIVGVAEGRWLIMFAETIHFFLNPLTGKQVMLPPQITISGAYGWDPSFFIEIVASSDPTDSNCLIAGLTKSSSSGFSLAFCRLTDKAWIFLDQDDEIKGLKFHCIIFCDGKLYASASDVTKFLIVFDLRRENKNGVYKAQRIVMEHPWPTGDISRGHVTTGAEGVYCIRRSFYSLAQDSVHRELMLVIHDAYIFTTECPVPNSDSLMKRGGVLHYDVLTFRVYKMEVIGDHFGWKQVTDLGDRALFTGDSANLFMSTVASGKSIQRNWIYYAFGATLQIGMFCLSNQRRKWFMLNDHTIPPCISTRFPLKSSDANVVWFVQTLV